MISLKDKKATRIKTEVFLFKTCQVGKINVERQFEINYILISLSNLPPVIILNYFNRIFELNSINRKI